MPARISFSFELKGEAVIWTVAILFTIARKFSGVYPISSHIPPVKTDNMIWDKIISIQENRVRRSLTVEKEVYEKLIFLITPLMAAFILFVAIEAVPQTAQKENKTSSDKNG